MSTPLLHSLKPILRQLSTVDADTRLDLLKKTHSITDLSAPLSEEQQRTLSQLTSVLETELLQKENEAIERRDTNLLELLTSIRKLHNDLQEAVLKTSPSTSS